MELKRKTKNIVEGFTKTKKSLSEANLDDLTRVYKKLLKKLPDISHLKNIVLFMGVATLLIFVLFAQRFSALNEYLPIEPNKGGVYSGGIVGEIKQLNPLYSPTNSAETSAVSLIFSGLTKRSNNREVIGDLAESWKISKDKTTYTFKLKNNIFWHDGEKLTANDVVFTYNTIINPDVGSPRLSTWRDVKIEAPDESTVVFTLPNVYSSFIYLTDAPIIPEHILSGISAENLRSAEFSKNPIGSGPYIFEEFREIKDTQEVHLLVNKNYYGTVPYIEEIYLKAYKNYSDLTGAYAKKEVYGIEKLLPSEMIKENQLPNIAVYNLSIPEYEALFMNMASGTLTDEPLRKAIALAIDKEKIIKEIYHGQAIKIDSPILPGFLGYNSKIKQKYDLAAAKKILRGAKYTVNKEGNLFKDNKKISLRLVVNDGYLRVREAETIAKMIEELGVEITVESYPFNVFIEEYIRPRNYDLLLVSQNLGADSDIYSFYHSNMAEDPGLNFSGISERQIDKYLEEARTIHDQNERSEKYKAVSKFITDAYPAVYICWPSYLYGVSNEVKGIHSMKLIEPKDRFTDIADWYINEKRDR